MSDDVCRCLFGKAQWTPWLPSMFKAVTETRWCRRCTHRAYRIADSTPGLPVGEEAEKK